MTSFADTIVANARITLGYAETLAKDIPSDRFARFAAGAAGPVASNHPAFVIGHLALYPGRCCDMLGLSPNPLAASEAEEALFGPSASCVDDADATVYPGKDELLERFASRQKKVMEIITAASDERLLEPTPVERYRGRFPFVGSVVGFLTSGHAMLHLGQLSAWRRFEGLGPAM